MSGRTPGPWKVIVGLSGRPMQVTSADLPITLWGAISRPASENAKANAHLIAAAPDLLTACRRAIEDHDEFGRLSDAGEAVVFAAIAKAEGRT